MSDRKQLALELDPFDQVIFDDMREHSSNIAELAEQAEGLTQDTMLSLYKQEPKIREDAGQPSRRMMETLHNLPEYQNLRAFTTLDETAAALGTMSVAPTMIRQLEEYETKVEQQRQEGKLSEAEEKAATDAFFDQARRHIRRAAAEAAEKVEKWSEDCVSFGVTPGDLAKMPLEEKIALSQQFANSRDLRRVLDMVGKMRNFAQAASEYRTSHGADEIIDVTIGGEISRLLPVELGKFKRQKALFAKDLFERNLLNYNLQGQEKLGRGPIIIMLDVSQSMRGVRSTWAKALALSTLVIAEKQQRSVYAILFDTHARREWFFREGKASVQDKLDLASYESDGGGTAFYEPLVTAFANRSLEADLKPADIIFVTDGESRMSDQQVADLESRKKATQTRIHSLFIQAPFGSEALRSVSDSVHELKTLDPGLSMPIFTSVSN